MVNNSKQATRRKQRVALAAQLVYGEDDDIIAWLNTIPTGNRAAMIKQIVRQGLGLAPPQLDQVAAQNAQIVTQDDLDQMRQQLDDWANNFTRDIMRMIESRQPVAVESVVVDNGSRIDQERKDKRAKRLKAAQW